MTAIYRLCSTKQKVLQYQSAITKDIILKSWKMGRGGSQVVSVLAFYSNDPGLNPAEAYSLFLYNLCLKIT